jgi:putative effector of murein hydrolase LrgA (UPF0299 family)
MTDSFDYNSDLIEIGIRYTAIGALCFVAGVQAACFLNRKVKQDYHPVERRDFWYFCLLGGLFVQFGLGFLNDLASVAAAVNRGSALWMLGALLGLRFAFSRTQLREVVTWAASSFIGPALILLLSGFMSYGATALTIVTSPLIISVRRRLKLIVMGCLLLFLTMTVFVNYYAHRTEFRAVAWSGASFADRVDAATLMFSNFQWFDPTDEVQLHYLDERLNQNLFVGLAARRIEQEQVDYLYGRSIWEGVLALVPRILWPEKPVYGGSPKIVTEMTGLHLNQETSWGVGNVMEFQINFGLPGVIIGFLILGFALGWLDYKAAIADARGDLNKLMLFFLVAVALIQPNGSMVELAGGSAAAVVAAYGWMWVWQLWLHRSKRVAAGQNFAPSP